MNRVVTGVVREGIRVARVGRTARGKFGRLSPVLPQVFDELFSPKKKRYELRFFGFEEETMGVLMAEEQGRGCTGSGAL